MGSWGVDMLDGHGVSLWERVCSRLERGRPGLIGFIFSIRGGHTGEGIKKGKNENVREHSTSELDNSEADNLFHFQLVFIAQASINLCTPH